MRAAKAFRKLWHFAAIVLLLTVSVAACGGGNDPDPIPEPLATAPGDYFITRFLVTNTADPQDVVDGASFGLSVFFVLNEDGSVSGGAQVPSEPPDPTQFSGNWQLDDETLTITFSDNEGNVRTLVGSLSFDEDDDVVFSGSQTAGPSINIGNDGQTYTISTFEMQKYASDVTNADLSGEWVAVSGTAFKNTDSSVTENLIGGGEGLTLIFDENGNLEVRNTFAGGGEDNFIAPYTILDNFHFSIVVENETQVIVYGLVDDVLKIYIYDINRSFGNDSTSSPATLTYVLERQ